MYKEVTTKYPCKCAKCNRDIKVGWTVHWEEGTKNLYCKPCYAELTKATPPPVTRPATESQQLTFPEKPVNREYINAGLNAIRADINALREVIVSLGIMVQEIGKILPAKPVKKSK